MKRSIMRKLLFLIIVGILYIFALLVVDRITDYMFRKAPIYYNNAIPIEVEGINIKYSPSPPKKAKAFVAFREGNLYVYISPEAKYLQKIIPEIERIAYKISILRDRVIKPIYIMYEDMKPLKFESIKIKILGIILSLAFVASGLLFTPFTPGYYLLLNFKYYTEFFFTFSKMILSILPFFAIFYIFFPEYIYDTQAYIYLSMGAIFFISIFMNIYFEAILFSAFVLYLLYTDIPGSELSLKILAFAFVLNVIINTIRSKLPELLVGKEVFKSDRERDDNKKAGERAEESENSARVSESESEIHGEEGNIKGIDE